ncbi:MAG: polysaccharide deacetylase family protein [Acetobacterales bacterium]
MDPQDYGPFPFSPITRRPKLEWPGGARVALWVIPNLEFFPLTSSFARYGGKGAPNPRVWGERDYGNRVGVWRCMQVMERYGVPGTAATNSDLCDKHPEIIEEGVRLGWEFIGHNENNSMQLGEMPPEQEQASIRKVLDTIGAASGTRPAGWLSAGRQETWNTLDYLVGEDLLYVADWPNDDQPYLMDIGGRKLVQVPYSSEINDFQAFVTRRDTVDEFVAMTCRHFDVMYREGAESGRVMPISIHPYLMGLPHRIDAFDRILEYCCRHRDVWITTGAGIARNYLDACAGHRDAEKKS